MFSDSFFIKYKVKFCDCYTFVCSKCKGKICDSYTAEIHLLQILRQILWLLHQRFISMNVWKLYSAIFEYKVKFLNKKLCSLNFGWLKETFCQYVTIHGLDKYKIYIQCFKIRRESFIRIKLILNIHKDLNFAGWFLIHLIYLSCLYFCYHFW